MVRTWWAALAVCVGIGCAGSSGTSGAARGHEGSTGASGAGPAEEPAQASESPGAPEASDLPPPMQELLAAHDRARAEHCAPPLAWSPELATVAEAWAAELASRGCPLQHSQSPYGENLFMATAGSRSPSEVVDVWVSEREGYRFARGGFSMETGHFTQVVWAATERVGCATLDCDGMDLWVCNYDPPGNVRGEYRENVLPTSCTR